MKKIILLLAVMMIGYTASAQTPEGICPGMKYKELKEYYNYKDYVKAPDQYRSPVGVGIASFVIPGLGQMICGEGWRGVAYLGGWLASHFVTLCGIAELNDYIYYAGITGAVAMRAISTVGATRIAKVKNMYKRDLAGSYSLEVDLYPSMNYVKTVEGVQPTAGLTFALRF